MIPDLADPVDNFLESSRSFFLGKDYIALLELAMAARTDRRIARIFHSLFKQNRKRHDGVWIDALARAGYSKRTVARFVDLANCVFRGAALMSAWGLPPSLYRPLLQDLHALAPTAKLPPSGKLLRSSPRKQAQTEKTLLFHPPQHGILYVLDGVDDHVTRLATDFLDTPDIDVLHHIAGLRVIAMTPRGLSHFMPLAASINASPSVLPPVFFSAS